MQINDHRVLRLATQRLKCSIACLLSSPIVDETIVLDSKVDW